MAVAISGLPKLLDGISDGNSVRGRRQTGDRPVWIIAEPVKPTKLILSRGAKANIEMTSRSFKRLQHRLAGGGGGSARDLHATSSSSPPPPPPPPIF